MIVYFTKLRDSVGPPVVHIYCHYRLLVVHVGSMLVNNHRTTFLFVPIISNFVEKVKVEEFVVSYGMRVFICTENYVNDPC